MYIMDPERVPGVSFQIWQRKVSDADAAIRRCAGAFRLVTLEDDILISACNDAPVVADPLRQPLEDWVTVLRAIDSSASRVNPKPSSIVWSGLRCIIEYVRKTPKRRPALLKMVKLVAYKLRQFEMSGLPDSTLLQSPEVQDRMVWVYGILTDICCKAIHHFRKKTLCCLRIRNPTKASLSHAIGELDSLLDETSEKPSSTGKYPIYDPSGSESGARTDNLVGYIDLPFDPLPHFFGRRDTLDSLYAYFTSARVSDRYDSSVHPRVCVLWGTPGVGKTQIAITLASVLKHVIPNVFWISSDHTDNVANGYMRIARTVDSIPREYLNDQKLAILKVKDWLKHSSQDWLIVFDNVPDNKSMGSLWPSGGKGRILITTRNAGLKGPFEMHSEQIAPFSDSEGLECFLKLLPTELRQGALRSPDTTQLVSELGGLPLALTQAAGFIWERRCTTSKYLDLFRHHRHSACTSESEGYITHAYKSNFITTFQLAYNAVGASNRKAQELLNILSWFDPDEIPDDILNPTLGLFEANPVQFEEVMAILLRSGLLVRSNGSVSVHRLIQMTAMCQMDPETRRRSFGQSVMYIKASFSSFDIFGPLCPLNCPPFDQVRHVLAQILSLSKKQEAWGRELQIPEFADLCRWIGDYLSEISNMKKAKEMFQKAYDIYKECDQYKHQRAIAMGGLGWQLMREGMLASALDMMNQAVQLMEAAVGPAHAHNSWMLSNRGRIHLFRGDIPQSLEDSYQSFDVMNQVDQELQHTEDSTRALSIYRNFYAISLYASVRGGAFGDLYEPCLKGTRNVFNGVAEPAEMEAMKKPIELSRQSMRDLIRLPGWWAGLAWVEISLSWMLLYIGDLNNAELTTLAALNHFQQGYPKEVCGVGVAKIQLADCYARQGSVTKAHEEYRAGLENFEHSVGRQNPLYITGCHKMANFLCQQERYKEACVFYEIALAGFRDTYGESNPQTKMTENNLAVALINIGETARGLQLLEVSLIYRENRYGQTHKFTLRASENHEAAKFVIDGVR